MSAFYFKFEKTSKRIKALEHALDQSSMAPGKLEVALDILSKDINKLNTEVNGNAAKNEIGEKSKPTLGERSFAVYRGIERSTYGPTASHKEQMIIIEKQLKEQEITLSSIDQRMDAIYNQMKAAGAPFVEE
jgi:uncharacterized coiled-coil protein SlyX